MHNKTPHQQSGTMIHKIDKVAPTPVAVAVIILIFATILGGATGFFASKVIPNPIGNTASKTVPTNETEKAADGSVRAAGIKDAKVFKDTAEGVLREGGFEDEGSFHLERPGGKSQNVYLTSSTVDLSQFVGKKVSVMGKTFAAEKAGWLMDVGYIEVK
ncbi:MAG: hypothetical protein N2691_00545 [Patescibacteria group bacterium]|nr:hypothetical protein [Patescibacteria group bacterium]